MNIKTICCGILFLSFFACVRTKKIKPNYQGTWIWEQGLPEYHFSINISEIKNSQLQGGYCGYPSDLSRIDCGNEKDRYCKIVGELTQSDTVFIKFKSCYSGKEGKAMLIYLGVDSVKWITTENPFVDVLTWNGVVKEAVLVRNKEE